MQKGQITLHKAEPDVMGYSTPTFVNLFYFLPQQHDSWLSSNKSYKNHEMPLQDH